MHATYNKNNEINNYDHQYNVIKCRENFYL